MEKVLLICGPPGVGKSSISKAFAEAKNWLCLDSDESDAQGKDQMALLGIRDAWNENGENYFDILASGC